MARVAVRESVTLAGRAERARAARAFVREMLGPGHPCGDVAVLLVSEVFSNRSAASPLKPAYRPDGPPSGPMITPTARLPAAAIAPPRSGLSLLAVAGLEQ
jgi:hypothetical protein